MNKRTLKIVLALFLIVGGGLLITLQSSLPFFKEQKSTSTTAKDTTKSQPVAPPEKEYGFIVDSFRIEKNNIQHNETLAEILMRYHVSAQTIDLIAKKAPASGFDLRKIRRGKTYKIFCTKDSLNKAKCFIYEPNPIDYYVIDLTDSVQIRKGEKPVETKTRTMAGVIHSSLYETLNEQDVSPLLALKLSEIYAWEIDFFRIEKGDRFKAIYEKKYVEGEPVGIGRIRAAYFEHRGDTTYAVYFKQGDGGDYFDRKGNSLRKQLLKAPLRYSRITSRFTYRRYHPIQKRYKAHLGTDYAAPTGTPVHSVGAGTVIAAHYSKYNGNYVKVRHNSVYTTQYLHLYKIASGIKRGVKVKQGETIGYVGSTGLATGPHLCYRFWKNGQQVDPFTVEIPPSKPVKKKYLKEYNAKKVKMIDQLDSISFPVTSKPAV